MASIEGEQELSPDSPGIALIDSNQLRVCLGCWVGRSLKGLIVAVLWEMRLMVLNIQGNFVVCVDAP